MVGSEMVFTPRKVRGKVETISLLTLKKRERAKKGGSS